MEVAVVSWDWLGWTCSLLVMAGSWLTAERHLVGWVKPDLVGWAADDELWKMKAAVPP
jgi:hypothetical protein